MAQLSRPYQLGLLGIVILAAAWLVLLQGHSASTPSSASSAVPSVQTVTVTPASPAKHAPATGSKIYHGPAPGVGGLTNAIAKAQGAVSTSQQNAKALEEKSAAASNESSGSHPSSSSSAAAATGTATKAVAKPTVSATAAPASKNTAKPSKPATPGAGTRSTVAVNQRAVEAQLAQGKIALILFWEPKGAEDLSVRRALQHLHGKLAVNIALAGQVASFGTITRGIQVYGTPTLLIVDKQGRTITLTGLQDAFAIQQAISELSKS